MSTKKIEKYCSDIGKYLIDISKIVLGSVVISPVVKNDFSISADSHMLISGVIASLFTVIFGIFLMNKNK
jgi:hypothetical protein